MVRLLAVLILLFTTSCQGLSPREEYLIPESQNEITISKEKIDIINQATALYINKHTYGWGSTGTAFCIEILNGASLWVTCRHVAEIKEADKQYITPKLQYEMGDSLIIAEVKNIKLSDKYDIAVFYVNFEPKSKLKLSRDNSKLKPKRDVLMASGCLVGLFPPITTVGVYEESDEEYITTTVSGWYGSSGSAIVNLRTMQIVSLVSRFTKLPPKTNQIKGVRSELIIQFLESL